jgi:hypothetical protein
MSIFLRWTLKLDLYPLNPILIMYAIPKAKSFPRKVCMLHHHDQESTFLLWHSCFLDRRFSVLLRGFAGKRNSKPIQTLCFRLRCAIPIHHPHSDSYIQHHTQIIYMKYMIIVKADIYLPDDCIYNEEFPSDVPY